MTVDFNKRRLAFIEDGLKELQNRFRKIQIELNEDYKDELKLSNLTIQGSSNCQILIDVLNREKDIVKIIINNDGSYTILNCPPHVELKIESEYKPIIGIDFAAFGTERTVESLIRQMKIVNPDAKNKD